jgi:P27 family predicted phage terminase small subunit
MYFPRMRRKPTAIKILEGNRGHRPLPTSEPKGAGQPSPPRHLQPEQLELWHAVVASLPPELLSAADNSLIERMAVAWSTFRETTRRIDACDLLARGDRGQSVRNPLLIVRTQAAAEMETCSNALGLSPVARSRIAMPATLDYDPLEILLGPSSIGRS